MIKKHQKFINVGFCFLSFLFIGLFCLSINRISAADLEVQYPIISGQTITASSGLPDYVKYLFNAGMLIGSFAVFISLVIAGATYFLSPVSAELLAGAKDRVSGAISGLLILALTYLIITTINPQLSFFNLNKLPPTPQPPPAETKAPGVYFYKSGCSDDSVQPNIASVPDLGLLKNKVNSVGIVQDTDNQDYYMSILYDTINFQGRCQYLNPNQSCQSVSPFASSASVYKYDFSPNGDGVYFYRKSYFDDSGGYYKVGNSEINGIYKQRLENLKFIGVPEDEQDCIKYDANGNCVGRRPPSLGGENISSVKINGDYLVLFVYFGTNDSPSGIWTSCQEFPTINDINKFGPEQIKWEGIRNNNNVIPNYVVIIPIQRD